MQIQISWLLQKPTDLDLHCLLKQAISGVSRSRVRVRRMTCFPSLKGYTYQFKGTGYTSGRFSASLCKADNLCGILFDFLHPCPYCKGVYCKWKEFAPNESEFFPFRVDPFSKWSTANFGANCFLLEQTPFQKGGRTVLKELSAH